MKQALISFLCAAILYPHSTSAQNEASHVPAWVNVASASAITVMGSLWYYNTFVKSGRAKSDQTLKKRALSEMTYIATSEEKKALKKLQTAEEIHEFMDNFWRKRDPNPATAENEVEEQYLERLDYANQHFSNGNTDGWKTDQGRVYILYGPPDEIQREPWTNLSLSGGETIKALETWFYYRPSSGVDSGIARFTFADFEGFGKFTQIYSSERGELSHPALYFLFRR